MPGCREFDIPGIPDSIPGASQVVSCLVQFFAEEKQLLYGRPRTKFQGFQINVFDRRLAARKSRKEDKKIPYLLNFLGNAGDPLLQRRCGGKDRSRQG